MAYSLDLLQPNAVTRTDTDTGSGSGHSPKGVVTALNMLRVPCSLFALPIVVSSFTMPIGSLAVGRQSLRKRDLSDAP
jgi:hypothetical protein